MVLGYRSYPMKLCGSLWTGYRSIQTWLQAYLALLGNSKPLAEFGKVRYLNLNQRQIAVGLLRRCSKLIP